MTTKVRRANRKSPELGRPGELSEGGKEATGRSLKGTAFCLGAGAEGFHRTHDFGR